MPAHHGYRPTAVHRFRSQAPARRQLRPLALAGLATAMLLLAGCGGGDTPMAAAPAPSAVAPATATAAVNSAGAPAAPSPNTAAALTTLGTRAGLAQPEPAPLDPASSALTWQDYNPPATAAGQVNLPLQFIPMSDGTLLAAHVSLPADAAGRAQAGPFPTLLVQTAYNGLSGQVVGALGGADPYLVTHGYATVVVDVRGTGQSQGTWQAFDAVEQADYAQVVAWVRQQPWCNGSLGVYGVSYVGITALLTAEQNLPGVKAAFPVVPIGDGYRDIVFTGGQVNPTFIPLWLGLVAGAGLLNPEALLANPAQAVPALLQHVLGTDLQFEGSTLLNALLGAPGTAYDGDFWRVRSPLERAGQVQVPTFVVGGLHDLFQRSEPMVYEAIKAHAPARLLVGPWTHLLAAMGAGLPQDGVPPLNHLQLQWFDQYVKGLPAGAERMPRVTQYVTGYGHYAVAPDWPHPQVQADRWYLHGDGSLSGAAPGASEPAHQVAQLPVFGLCSQSASQWTAGALGLLAPLPCFSNDNLVALHDASFATAPLDADYYLNGPIEADIWISTTAQDAGVSVRVDDVAPDGTAVALTNGIQTASLRAVDARRSRTFQGVPIQPWHPYTQASAQPVQGFVQVPVEIFTTSALIARGHRLRVLVGASDLPQGVPPLPGLLQSAAGVLTIAADAAHPSSVVLPHVPASVLP